VRHPFERLVSAYRFTFQRASGLGDEGGLASRILATYPTLTSAQVQRDLSSGILITYTPSWAQHK
jgi:hypothetical protein